MKKLLLFSIFLILLLLSVNTISALEIDNVGWYSENDMKIEIRNWLGLTRLGDAILTSHSHVDEVKSVMAGEKRLVMQYDLNFDEDYINGLGNVKFIDERTRDEVKRPYYFAEAIYGDVRVNEFGRKCSLNKNMTEVCESYISGSHMERKIVGWKKLDSRDIKSGNRTIGLFADVRVGDHIDGIWTIAGQPVNKHASWADSLTVGLWAYWNFDSDSTNASNIEDVMNSTQNGTNTNLTTSFTSITGIIGQAIDLNGTTGINFGNQDTVFGNGAGNNYTLSIWIRGGLSVAGTSTFWASDNDNSLGADDVYSYITSDTNMVFATEDGDERNMNANNTLQETWQHFVFWKNSTTLRGWQNGSLNIEVIGDVFQDKTNAGNSFVIGDNLNVNFLNASIDETGLWARALSDAEIADLWNNGAGITFPENDPPAVSLNDTPADAFTTVVPSLTLGANSTDDKGLLNISLYINGELNTTDYNTTGSQTSLNISRTLTFNSGWWNWSAYACDNEANCTITGNKTFLVISIVVNNESFNAITTEAATETFQVNVSVATGLRLTLGRLHYNGTGYDGTITDLGSDQFSVLRSLAVPAVDAETNFSFFWELRLEDDSNINSSLNNQTVLPFNIDNCTTQGLVILNYTLRDEDTQILVDNSTRNSTIEVDLQIFPLGSSIAIVNFSTEYLNQTQALVCVANDTLTGVSFRLDAQARYDGGEDYISEFNNIQNFTLTSTSVPQNITLLNLLSDRSQEFLIRVKDKNFLALDGAIVDITRKYVAEGTFKTVEVPMTDQAGETLGHFVLGDVIYTLIVKKNGVIIATLDNVLARCTNVATGNCIISINEFSSSIATQDYTTIQNISFATSFDDATSEITTVFTTSDGGVKTVLLNGTLSDRFGNTTICSDTLVSSSGTLICTIPSTFGNATVVASLVVDGVTVSTSFVTITDDPADLFGGTGIILALLIILTLSMLFVSSPVGQLVGLMVGIALSSIMLLYTGGSIIGVGSIMIWLIVTIAILIWKINKNKELA